MAKSFAELLQDPKSPEHEKVLTHFKGLIDISRNEMQKNYGLWDEHDATFRGQRQPDKEDRNSEAKGQPKKVIVQLTYSQVMTYVAFCVMMVTQNKRFFELEPTGSEDNPLREPVELILERDTRRNAWNTFLIQFFLDTGRFCLGAAEICWLEEYRKIRLMQEKEETGAFGVESKTTVSEFTDIPTFIGNKVYPISPYKFFPDTRLPLTRYQEGEFCGSEDMFSLASLKRRGDCFNLDKIPKFDEKEYEARRKSTRIDVMETRKNPNMGGVQDSGDAPDAMVKSGSVVVTKVCADITPADFKVGDAEPLGTEAFPVRYICWIANDKTVIRFEEAYYLHGMFPYVCAQFLPDQHRTINEGLADVCSPITSLITWLINAHMTSLKSTIDGKFIVDPAGVDVKSLESRSPYIFLKKNASQTGVDRYIQQFQVQDVTGNFMQDSAQLTELGEKISGYSGQMQGQYTTGRRDATQSKIVAQGAASRGKMTLSAVWDNAFEPLGKQFIANNRQEMDFETFSRIVGEGPHAVTAARPQGMTTEELYALFHADPLSIATSEDFFIFDGTSPSEKAYTAQAIQELVLQIFSNPAVAQVMGYGPDQIRAMIQDIYTLRGVTPSRLPAPIAPASPAAAPTNISPMPAVAPGTTAVSNG